jgi:DNA-directed RNA polymerase subunit RPC12/RpoP
MDFSAALVGSLPWRCSRCGARFRSRTIPFSQKLSAHCAICGNRELKRIAPEHVTGFLALFKRLLGVPAYRCIPCRHKFFSIRPLSKQDNDDQLRIAS